MSQLWNKVQCCFGNLWIVCRFLLCCFGPLPLPLFPLPAGGEFSRGGKAQQPVLDEVELKEEKDRGRNENGQVERCIFLLYRG